MNHLALKLDCKGLHFVKASFFKRIFGVKSKRMCYYRGKAFDGEPCPYESPDSCPVYNSFQSRIIDDPYKAKKIAATIWDESQKRLSH